MKKTQRLLAALLISLVSLPATAFAQAGSVTAGLGTLQGLVETFTKGIVSSLVALFATMAMAAFFWGIAQFIWGSREGKPDVMTNGKNFMLWGLIALFVMFSVWGIIIYVQNIFGIQGNTIKIPRIEINNSTSVSPVSPTGLPSGETGAQVYTCSDGVTKYYNQSDAKFCPQGTTPAPSPTGTQQPVGYCGDGTPYYSTSDAKFCSSGSTVNGVNCATITDSGSCTSVGCSWSDSEGICSR